MMQVIYILGKARPKVIYILRESRS
jgi:hypothetical protein